MYLSVDSLTDINNITKGLNNITLRKVNAKSYGYDKMYIDKDLIEDKLYEWIYQFSGRKLNHRAFYFALLDNIYIHFMIEMGELSRYYLLQISISGYNFSKTIATQDM